MRRWRSFILIGVVFLVVCGLGAAIVSTAQASLPGDRIYSIKIVLEQARFGLAADDVARARLRLEFLDTRLNEFDQTVGSGSPPLTLKMVDAALIEAARAVAGLPDSAQGDMRAQLARLALRAIDALTRWQASGGSDAMLAEVLLKARTLADVASDPNAASADLLLALSRFGASDASAGTVEIASRNIPLPADLIAVHQPPFSGRHAEVSCNACHVDGQVQGMSATCTSCHDDPHKSWFEQAGFGCLECHTDVVFTPSMFDHERFPDCQVCHSIDAPVNHYPGQCSNCHTATAWEPADFNHTGFTDCAACHASAAPVNHYPGQCSNCHTTNAWSPAAFNHTGFTDCVACHSPVVPANHYPGQCSSCHTTTAWLPATFNHSGFTDCAACHSNVEPANHYSGQCSNCHNTNAWKPAFFNHAGFTDCAACHASPSNHYSGQCSNCHNTGGWTPANFNHAGFTDCAACHASPSNHFAGQCSNCHNTGGWTPANFNHSGFTDCAACHAPPSNHFAGQCSDCHNTSSWEGATFNHTFPTSHHGANGDCAACHPGGDTSSWSCDGCHDPKEMDDKHKEVSGYSDNCMQCHANGKKPKDQQVGGLPPDQMAGAIQSGMSGDLKVWSGLALAGLGPLAAVAGLKRRSKRK